MLQLRRGIAIAIALVGCHRFEGETWIFPLSELRAELRIGRDSRASTLYSSSGVQLHILGNSGDYCRIVSPRHTHATMNGKAGEVFPGEEYRGAFNGRECIDPQFGWDDRPTGTVELVISDDSASWTFIAENPFDAQYPRVELISHDVDVNPIMSGDTVVLEIYTVHPISNTRFYMRDGTEMLLDVSEGNGLTRTGNELSFVMPTVAMARSDYFSVSGELDVLFTRCDAPLGCQTSYPFSDSVRAEIAP